MTLIYRKGACANDYIEVSTEPGPTWGNSDSEMVSITTTTGLTTMRRQDFIHMIATAIREMGIGIDVLSELVKMNVLDAIGNEED